MHVIVAGGGAVGSQVAAALEAAAHDVVVVEADEARAAGLSARGMSVVVGNACGDGVLEEAGALRTDLLVACSGSDEENLVIAELAKRHLEIPRVVAQVNDDENRWLFDAAWGVDAALSPAFALVSLIEEIVAGPPVAALGEVPRGGTLVDVRLDAGSPACGCNASELGLAPDDAVVGVVRRGRLVAARDADRFRAGDHLVVATDPAGMDRLRVALAGGTGEPGSGAGAGSSPWVPGSGSAPGSGSGSALRSERGG